MTHDASAGPQHVDPSDRLVYAIEQEVVRTTPMLYDTGSPEAFAAFLRHDAEPLVYRWHDQRRRVVGYLALALPEHPAALEVRSIAVRPTYQGQGYGSAMMAYAETTAQAHHKDRLTLVTNPDNTRAVAFYRHLGYAVVGRVANYYGDGTARLRLEKRLL